MTPSKRHDKMSLLGSVLPPQTHFMHLSGVKGANGDRVGDVGGEVAAGIVGDMDGATVGNVRGVGLGIFMAGPVGQVCDDGTTTDASS